jgi:Brp/Blh family beta-carotene 15,15'-monooxygenase
VTSLLLFASLLHFFAGAADLLKWPIAAALLIVSLGVPHGALDVALASHRQRLASARQTSVFLGKYVGLAGIVASAWWLWPSGALATFLLLAAYHFGGDWLPSARGSSRFLLGSATLCATTITHRDQVELVFSWLATPADAALIASAMSLVAPGVIVGAVLSIARTEEVGTDTRTEFMMALIGAIVLPPITFFVIYFCLLHSVRHVFDIRAELAGHSGRELFLAGLPYAAIAICFSLAGAIAFAHIETGPALLSSVFVSLAALTVPHIVLVDWTSPADPRI